MKFPVLTIILSAFLFVGLKACADAPVTLTQRKINGIAAKIEQALSAILETPKLRRSNESIRSYCQRLTARSTNEVTEQYRKRLTQYADSIERAVPSGMTGGKLPALAETSAVNQARWKRLAKAFSYLPVRVKKVRTALASGQNVAPELEQTLALLLSARDELRDARP